MEKSKIALTSIAALAITSTVIALKFRNISGYQFLYDQNQDGVCTSKETGFVSNTYQRGYVLGYVTATSEDEKQCAKKYYLVNP
ncbi:hypothetical protein HNQ91_002038 [Filimonas zeae]|uniref:Uncharacterized protein n=1 Tax=Filimonas zeae TaxID=1737353 RepID=A0A917IYQ0_9BACT|nr:hypothetical protein [Filimonas zeae]MDR6338987.1 hypothetical protein [Filimonas zeae]GGH65648.1 hypothetical protein GCM10011379_19000 [Filimonas zeae]